MPTVTFSYTGSEQTYVVPAGVTSLNITCYGAEGGAGKSNGGDVSGGYGGYSTGTLAVTPGETLYIYVGGMGASAPAVTGGFNGGGTGYAYSVSYAGSGGGGASDIRQGGNALGNRKIVAGGGGGGTDGSTNYGRWGGNGGALSGGSVSLSNNNSPGAWAQGGTQSAGGTRGYWDSSYTGGGSSGSLGAGGFSSGTPNAPIAGGGGGYYGGGTGAYISAAGGSGYVGGVSGGTTAQSTRTGNGEVTLTYVNMAPTATNLSPNTFRDTRVATNFTWTYSDSEGNAQNAYQIQYRLKGSTGSWTTVTGTTAQSHTFAANTFTLGQEYEWQVRVSDATAGYGEWSALTYFLAGTSTWSYGPQVATSTQSGTFPKNFVVNGDFEAATAIADGNWHSNTAFGSMVASTIARTTTKPDTGSYSLEVTLPTGISNAYGNYINALVIGKSYRITARVWMDVGGPDFYADMLYQSGQNAPVSSVKGAWTTVTSEFVYTVGTNSFFGVRTNSAATAGQKMYIDNVTMEEIVEQGTYYVQVRTADAEGFGPWSSSDVVEVKPPVNPPLDINLTPPRVGGTISASWFYSNSLSNAQTKYQIQYRRKS